MGVCSNVEAEYCLLGLKFGTNNPFEHNGNNAVGPKTSAINITYSFQEKNGMVSTHTEIAIPSESFEDLEGCSQSHSQIREERTFKTSLRLFESWSKFSNRQNLRKLIFHV